MNAEINYETNPLHGVSLKNLLIEMVDHYGFDILFAYLNINCFKTNPSINSSVIFLKKTDWAREKVEAFYMYEFKNLPKPSSEQFQVPPRDRVVPEDQTLGEPAELSLENAAELREKRATKAAAYSSAAGRNSGVQQNTQHFNKRNNHEDRKDGRTPSTSKSSSVEIRVDPWAKSRK